jgi:hypothetical protein
MKSISQYKWKLKFFKKLPFGNNIQLLLLKLISWWDKTNIIWVYVLLIAIFISILISTWSIYIIINNIT